MEMTFSSMSNKKIITYKGFSSMDAGFGKIENGPI